jgi:glyoxylase I family protein
MVARQPKAGIVTSPFHADSGSMTLTVESIHHVALGVADLARARHFYTAVLGLDEIPRPAFDFGGAWFRVGEQQIHLIVQRRTDTRRETRSPSTLGDHFALRVRSYRQTLDHLRSLGVPFEERPRNKTPWPQIYIVDPDGHTIELNAERLDE